MEIDEPDYTNIKIRSGYHLLMIFATLDGNFKEKKSDIIAEYLYKFSHIDINLDKENEVLLSIPNEILGIHFRHMADKFGGLYT